MTTINEIVNNEAVTETNNTSGLASERKDVREQVASLGEKFGQFKPYDSQLPLAEIEGTRIVKCLYQVNTKTGKKAQENAYTRVLDTHLDVNNIIANIDTLAPFVSGWLAEIEDSIIKEEHKNGALQFYTEKLSIDYLISYLEENANSGRLNKEMISEWFNSHLESELLEVAIIKLGLDLETASDADLAKAQRVVNVYKSKYELLASPKAGINEEYANKLLEVINKYDASPSNLSNRLSKKLTSIIAKSKQDEGLIDLL